MKKVTKEELVKKLKSLQTNCDAEGTHRKADSFLLEFINDVDVTENFNKIKKWYA